MDTNIFAIDEDLTKKKRGRKRSLANNSMIKKEVIEDSVLSREEAHRNTQQSESVLLANHIRMALKKVMIKYGIPYDEDEILVDLIVVRELDGVSFEKFLYEEKKLSDVIMKFFEDVKNVEMYLRLLLNHRELTPTEYLNFSTFTTIEELKRKLDDIMLKDSEVRRLCNKYGL